MHLVVVAVSTGEIMVQERVVPAQTLVSVLLLVVQAVEQTRQMAPEAKEAEEAEAAAMLLRVMIDQAQLAEAVLLGRRGRAYFLLDRGNIL